MKDLTHRISAGALVIRGEKVLVVRHMKPGAYDFWVAPGGGVIGTEDLYSAAKREVEEESGINIQPIRIAYIEEMVNPEQRLCKFWIYSEYISGELNTEKEEATSEYIVEAQFLTQSEIQERLVFPPILKSEFWNDLKMGFEVPKHLGIRAMDFY